MRANNYPGLFIAFEGADGAGKTTQAKLLLKYLQNKQSFSANKRIPSVYISFPRYQDSLWGQMVARYLAGDFGRLDDVDPYLASMLYAGDRLTAAEQIKKWFDDGKVVVCNRYVGSNMAHMGAKIKDKGLRTKYINWLEKLEYKENKIPREDLVIFLHVPVDVSRKLIRGRKLDIHEKDLTYLQRVISAYDEIAKDRKSWVKVDCTVDGKILEPYEIHKKVLGVLKRKGILRTQ